MMYRASKHCLGYFSVKYYNVCYTMSGCNRCPRPGFTKPLRLTRLDFLTNELISLPALVRKYRLVRREGFTKPAHVFVFYTSQRRSVVAMARLCIFQRSVLHGHSRSYNIIIGALQV